MRIAGLTHRPHSGPASQAGNARRRWPTRRARLVVLVDDAGRRGLGEASPLPGFGDDDLETARQDLERWRTRLPIDLGPDIAAGQVDGLAACLDGLASPAARCALETALLDLAGQRSARPIWSLLGADRPRPVPVAGLINTVDPAAAARQAERLRARGVACAKIKIGRPGMLEAESAVAEAVRAAGIASLRFDANGTLPAVSLNDDLARLSTFAPELIEEPAAAETLLAAALPDVPLGVDETLLRPDAAALVDRLAATGRLAAVVLKPMALGGVLPALAWAERAAAQGVDAVASHLFDGPIAWQAAAHLALALPASRGTVSREAVSRRTVTRAAGLDRHGGLDAWAAGVLPPWDGHRIAPSDRPGLGLDAEPLW